MTRGTLPGLAGLCLAASLAAACGGSSSTPGPATIAGDWSGTWQFVTSGVTVTDNVHVTFTQSDTVTGTWVADGGATGQFRFASGSPVSGTFSITLLKVNGQTCSGSGNLTGTVATNAVSLSVPSIFSASQCDWATNNQFSLHR